MKFLCPCCKAKYQIGDDKVAGRSVRMKCRKCGYVIQVSSVPGLGDALPGSEPPLGELDLAVRQLLAQAQARSLLVPVSPISGTLRLGRYAIIGGLGSGSQGETLDAVDKLNGRAVAIKRFHVRGAKSWKDVELAEREARVLSTLSHPNLPVYIEHFEEDGALYLVMAKIGGESLASLRRRRATLAQADVARFLADADSVLSYLHARVPPVIHRDIKPGNVILRQDGSFAFVDFGAVRDQLKPEGGSTVVGTFGYMAPEQFMGRALPASDVYAVGATALALVTGREPEDLPHRGLAIDVRAALGSSAQPWLVHALSAMLDPDPDKRAKCVPASGSGQRSAPAAASPVAGERRELREPEREQRQLIRNESRPLRQELNGARHGKRGSPGGPLVRMVGVLALTVARLASCGLFHGFLPVLLVALSLPFGRPLRRAAWRFRHVGFKVDHGLRHALDAVRGRPLGQARDREGTELEVPEPEPPRRTLVASHSLRVEVEPEAEANSEPVSERERRQSR